MIPDCQTRHRFHLPPPWSKTWDIIAHVVERLLNVAAALASALKEAVPLPGDMVQSRLTEMAITFVDWRWAFSVPP
jgi:hypothetical protein